LHLSASDTNRLAMAWQNPAAATNWTWTSDGKQITLTSYSGTKPSAGTPYDYATAAGNRFATGARR
jgi:hypothetical protein